MDGAGHDRANPPLAVRACRLGFGIGVLLGSPIALMVLIELARGQTNFGWGAVGIMRLQPAVSVLVALSSLVLATRARGPRELALLGAGNLWTAVPYAIFAFPQSGC